MTDAVFVREFAWNIPLFNTAVSTATIKKQLYGQTVKKKLVKLYSFS